MWHWVRDFSAFLRQVSSELLERTENNKGEYSNLEVDDLLAQAAVEQDSQTRFELYQEAEQMIIDDAPCLPLWFSQNYVLVKPYVKGYEISPLGIPLLSNVYLESP